MIKIYATHCDLLVYFAFVSKNVGVLINSVYVIDLS